MIKHLILIIPLISFFIGCTNPLIGDTCELTPIFMWRQRVVFTKKLVGIVILNTSYPLLIGRTLLTHQV